MSSLFTNIVTVTVGMDSQTVFPLGVDVDYPGTALLLYNNLLLPYTEGFTIAGQDLTLLLAAPTTTGEKLHLLYKDDNADLFPEVEVFTVLSTGQSEFPLLKSPEKDAIVVFVGLVSFIYEDGDYSVEDNVLTWGGAELTEGDVLSVMYRSGNG